MLWRRIQRRTSVATVAVLLPVLATFLVRRADAQLDTYPPDARSQAMGATFTAIAEGAAAGWWNPAALPFAAGISVMPYSHSEIGSGFEICFESCPQTARTLDASAGAMRLGPLGMGLVYEKFERTSTWESFDTMGWHDSSLRSFRLGAGFDLGAFVCPNRKSLQLGVGGNVKWVEATERGSSGSGNGEDAAVDADFALLVALRPSLKTSAPAAKSHSGDAAIRLGVALVNAFDQQLEPVQYTVRELGRELRFGIMFEFAGGAWQGPGPAVRLLFGLEGLSTLERYGSSSNAGTEIEFLQLFALRAGFAGVDDVGNKLSYGVGVDTHDRLGRLRFQVDAARASRDTDLPRLDATVHWRL